MSQFITLIQPMKAVQGLTEWNSEAEKGSSALSSVPFASVLQDALAGYEQAKAVSDADSASLVSGDVDDLARVQINSMKTSSMLNTTVQLTTRMVNAYKDIMQMQI